MQRFVLTIVITFGAAQLAQASSICATVGFVDDEPLSLVDLNVSSLSDPQVHFHGRTDKAGKVCIDHLPEGSYSVEASRSGFMSSRYYPVTLIFPNSITLPFRLPIDGAAITEGPIVPVVILNGTLADKGRPLAGIDICLFERSASVASACATTNDLGQYAMKVSPRVYRLVLTKEQKRIDAREIDLSIPGYYHNSITMPSK